VQRVLAREGAEGHGAKNRAVRRKVEPVDKAAGKHSQTAVVMKLPALARRGRQHRQGCPQGCAGWRGWEEAEGEPRRPLPRWIGVLRAILQIRRTPPMSPIRCYVNLDTVGLGAQTLSKKLKVTGLWYKRHFDFLCFSCGTNVSVLVFLARFLGSRCQPRRY